MSKAERIVDVMLEADAMSSVSSGMGGQDELPLKRKQARHFEPPSASSSFDVEGLINRDPKWTGKTAKFLDTLSLMKAYLEDPTADTFTKKLVAMHMPKT